MHRIFTRTFLTEILCNQKIVSCFIWIFLIVDLKVNNRVIIHFYDEINYKEINLYNINENSISFSKFVKKKFNCFTHDECLECSEFIIEDEKDFPLNFNDNEGESDKKIFINTKVMKYNDFLYFFNVLQQKSELNENFQISDFLLIMHILDVFKFKKDKNFSQIIRTLLLYIVLNTKNTSENYNLNAKTIISSSILKIIFKEFGKIYFFDSSLFVENTSSVEIKRNINEKYGINHTKTPKFVLINSSFFTAIDRCMRYNKEFLIIFRRIFEKLQISRAILYDSKISCQNISFQIPYILFSNIDELCFYFWENMSFFKFMSDNMIHKNVKVLTFIYCNFSSFTESLFDNFKFLQHIYFIDSYLENPIPSSKLNTYLEFFTCIYNDITKKNDFLNFLELRTDKQHKFENIDKVHFLELNKSSMSSQEFKISKYQVFLFNSIYYRSSCFDLSIYVSSLQIIKRISIIIKEISVGGLKFQNSSLYDNIKELFIRNSEFSNDFLRDILLIPSLEKFAIINSKALFTKRLTYKKQSKISDLTIQSSTFENFDEMNNFENSDEMINFVNCMSDLEILDLRDNKNLNMFKHKSMNKRIMLASLESLVLHDRGKSKGDLLNISGLKISQRFSLDSGWYEEGSLFKKFFNESLTDILDLSLNKFKIGIKDNGAMIRYSKIQKLYFLDCEFKNITFSQLFDVKKAYVIEELVLEKITLTIIDILFLSNLHCLKYLELNIKIFLIDIKDFFMVIVLNKPQLKIEIKVLKQYWREINIFKEVFQLSNLNIYEL